jgi:hypothetical protein
VPWGQHGSTFMEPTRRHDTEPTPTRPTKTTAKTNARIRQQCNTWNQRGNTRHQKQTAHDLFVTNGCITNLADEPNVPNRIVVLMTITVSARHIRLFQLSSVFSSCDALCTFCVLSWLEGLVTSSCRCPGRVATQTDVHGSRSGYCCRSLCTIHCECRSVDHAASRLRVTGF